MQSLPARYPAVWVVHTEGNVRKIMPPSLGQCKAGGVQETNAEGLV
jgi:hypothetical protein